MFVCRVVERTSLGRFTLAGGCRSTAIKCVIFGVLPAQNRRGLSHSDAAAPRSVMNCRPNYAAISMAEIEVGDPGRIRTCDLQLRRLLLYPLSYGAVFVSMTWSVSPSLWPSAAAATMY
jgi:hypothetical protein